MTPPPRKEVRRPRREPGADRALRAWLSAALLLVAPLGCGPLESATGMPALDSQRRTLEVDNGLAMNGLAMNGLAMNGLAMNGLAMNGLASADFTSWFQEDPAFADSVMHYVVQCAVAAGESRTYTDSSTSTDYTWWGNLGLAPDWASGAPASETEQRLTTACLAAHVNQYGLHMTFSILGRNARKQLIPFAQSELARFPRQEACFFGNLFTEEGIFFGLDRESLDGAAMRACHLPAEGLDESGVDCPPLVFVGRCQDVCTRSAEGPFYEGCAVGGATYPPLTTRLRDEDYQLLSTSW